MDVNRKSESHAEGAPDDRDTVPSLRPVERLWPYAELPELHSPEELAALDPELRAALWGERPQPFSLTVVFPVFDGANYDRAVELARSGSDYRVSGSGVHIRHRARFLSSEAGTMRELYQLVSHLDACEILVDERLVPYARELWLPLLWLVLLRGDVVDSDAQPAVADGDREDVSN